MVQDPRPSGKYYTKRFMNALGSANVYTHGARLQPVQGKRHDSGHRHGRATPSDVANSKMTMFIGRSYADAIRPSSVVALQKAHEKGAHIVLRGPAPATTAGVFADEWVPINPGTDLALVLAMSNVLVTRGRYDKEFVAANTVGFDEWAKELAEYPPEWAEGVTGIPADTIARLAMEFAEGGPRGLHRAQLARCVRLLVRELGRDGARHLPVQHALGLLEPEGRRPVHASACRPASWPTSASPTRRSPRASRWARPSTRSRCRAWARTSPPPRPPRTVP